MLIAIQVGLKMTAFPWELKLIILPTTIPIKEIPHGETTQQTSPSMFMTTGAEALVGAGTTHGFGTAGAGEALVGAGAGTTLGDGIAGAGAAALAGAGAVVSVGAGAAALAGAGTILGSGAVATAGEAATGTTVITIEDLPTIEVVEDIPIRSSLEQI